MKFIKNLKAMFTPIRSETILMFGAVNFMCGIPTIYVALLPTVILAAIFKLFTQNTPNDFLEIFAIISLFLLISIYLAMCISCIVLGIKNRKEKCAVFGASFSVLGIILTAGFIAMASFLGSIG